MVFSKALPMSTVRAFRFEGVLNTTVTTPVASPESRLSNRTSINGDEVELLLRRQIGLKHLRRVLEVIRRFILLLELLMYRLPCNGYSVIS
jgi:hypothetical protein